MEETELRNILAYYRDCIKEEVKTSAFRNIKSDKNNVYLQFPGVETFLHEFPTDLEVPEVADKLTELLIQRELDKTKQLVYGYPFVKGEINRKQVYTPLMYIPVEIKRAGARLLIEAQSSEITLNIGAIAEFVDNSIAEPTLSDIVQSIPNLPLTEENVNEFLNILHQHLPSLPITNEKGLVLANIPSVTAGMLKDMDTVLECKNMWNTALTNMDDLLNETQTPFSAKMKYCCSPIELSHSQNKALQMVGNSRVTAIIGGPGNGKSHTISGIVESCVANGLTVLVASKMNEAVDVVYKNLLKEDYARFAVRTGNKEYRKELADFIEDIVTGKVTTNYHTTEVVTASDACHTREYLRKLELAEIACNKSEEKLYAFKNSTMAHQLFSLLEGLKLQSDYNKACKEYRDILNVLPDDCRDMELKAFRTQVRERRSEVDNNTYIRRSLISLSKALRSNKGDISQLLEQFFPVLLQVIPVWCTTINSISSSIPCISGLFDVVIIDEASQCDIASCIPILYRAKQAVIVGDNKQLKYLSFLDNRKNIGFLEANNVDQKAQINFNYRTNSMFDMAITIADKVPVMLTEHFRCYPDIIEFSNSKFYGNRLVCKRADDGRKHVEVVQLPSGEHNKGKTINYQEADAIIESIVKQVKSNKCLETIGVVTPFRAQADLIKKALMQELTLEEFEKHRVLVGTAHEFQGSERDILYISWCITEKSPIQSYTFINNANLFNVAVTRGKNHVYNYISVDSTNMPNGLLREYIEMYQ